jgi:hypothetical protein
MAEYTFGWEAVQPSRRINERAAAAQRIGRLHTRIADWLYDQGFGPLWMDYYHTILRDLMDAQSAIYNGETLDRAASIMEAHNQVTGSPPHDWWSGTIHDLALDISGQDATDDGEMYADLRAGG